MSRGQGCPFGYAAAWAFWRMRMEVFDTAKEITEADKKAAKGKDTPKAVATQFGIYPPPKHPPLLCLTQQKAIRTESIRLGRRGGDRIRTDV
jgi:hypothetical protein